MKKNSSISSKQDVADIHPPVTAPPESEDSTAPPDVSATATSTVTNAPAAPAEAVIVESASTATPTQDGDRDAVTPADNGKDARGAGHTPAKKGKQRAQNGTKAMAKAGKTDATSTASTDPSDKSFSQEECVRGVRYCREHEIEQGMWLQRLRAHFMTNAAWAKYIQETFGISQPYAAKRIRAWKARKSIPDYLKDKLPQTVDFWAAVHDLDEGRRVEVLETLVRDCEANGKVPLRLKAKDVRATDDWKAAHKDKQRKRRNSTAQKDTSTLNSLMARIQDGEDVSDAIKNLPADQQAILKDNLNDVHQRYTDALAHVDNAIAALDTAVAPAPAAA